MRRSYSALLRSIASQSIVSQIGDAVISITQGNGYIGSTYTSTRSDGNWYADETAISGGVGNTFVMTALYEGKSITYRVGDRISNAIKLFVPSQLNGLVAWFDASDGNSVVRDGNNRVSRWNSKVGTVYATGPAAINYPTWNATGRNGMPAIATIAGNSQYMTLNNVATLPTGTATAHIFATAYHTTTGSWRGLYYTGNGGGGTNRLIMKYGSGNQVGLFTGDGTGDTVTTAPWSNNDHIVSAAFTSTRITAFVDGASPSSERTGTYSTTTTAGMLFNNYNSQYWDGSCQELMIFNRELSASERQKIEGYKAAKWNLLALLPADHPYKSTTPPAQLSIAITSGTGYFGSTYTATESGGQWFADGIAIANETNPTYVMTPASEGKAITYRKSGLISNTIKLFVPSQISNLVAWMDAADATTITKDTNNLVSQWKSKVGTLVAAQATTGLQPTHSATGRNGLPAVSSTGSSILYFNTPSAFPSGTATSHVLATAYSSATSGFGHLYFQGNENNSVGRVMLQFSNSNAGISAYGASWDLASSTAWGANDRIVSGLFKTGSQLVLAVDGAITPTTLSVGYSTPVSNTTLFANPGRSSNWKGSLSEIIVYGKELTTAERQQVEGYYAARWNLQAKLPVAHPYKATVPLAA